MAKRGKSMAIGEIRSTHPGFESDDPILARIYELPSSCRTLDRALPEALRLACSLPDWSLGRYRSLTDGLDGRAWTWHRAADPGTDTTPGGLVGLERGGGDHASPAELPPVAVELLRPEASRLHAVLYAAGLRTIGRLVVRAEDRPTALVELFGWPRVDGRSLRLVLARLEHVAARDRSREAVRRAAAFVRAHTSGRVDGRDRLPAAEPVAEPAAAAPPAVRPVPGLPDRDMLTDRLAMAIKRRRRDARGLLAVYHVDPGLGPGLSDIGPAAIVRRLTTIVRDTDTVAHGDRPDEFVVVAEELADVEAARDLGRRIVAACRKPVTYGPEARPLAARVGFLVAGPAHDDVDGILRDVALARDRVPAEGGLEMFDANVRIEDDNRQLIEAELRRAIGSRELFSSTSPSCPWPTDGSPGWRRSSAGSIRRWDGFRRRSSSGWRRCRR